MVNKPAVVEALEHERQIVRTNSRTVVGKRQRLSVKTDREPGRRGMVDCIADQVAQDDLQGMSIGTHEVTRGHLVADAQSRCLRTRSQGGADIFDQLAKIEWLTVCIPTWAAQRARRVNRRADFVKRMRHPPQACLMAWRETAIETDHLDIGAQRRQRRADLVAQVGGEFALARN